MEVLFSQTIINQDLYQVDLEEMKNYINQLELPQDLIYHIMLYQDMDFMIHIEYYLKLLMNCVLLITLKLHMVV